MTAGTAALVRRRLAAAGIRVMFLQGSGSTLTMQVPDAQSAAAKTLTEHQGVVRFRAVILIGLPAQTASGTPAPAASGSAAPSSGAGITQFDRYSSCRLISALRAHAAETAPGSDLVTCNVRGDEKFLLGPVRLDGTNVTSVTDDLASQGLWDVNLGLDAAGTVGFCKLTSKLSAHSPQSQLAVTQDDVVIFAPQVLAPICDGKAQIDGLSAGQARSLAAEIRGGPLPIHFQLRSRIVQHRR